jgi:hypothetical protein
MAKISGAPSIAIIARDTKDSGSQRTRELCKALKVIGELYFQRL